MIVSAAAEMDMVVNNLYMVLVAVEERMRIAFSVVANMPTVQLFEWALFLSWARYLNNKRTPTRV